MQSPTKTEQSCDFSNWRRMEQILKEPSGGVREIDEDEGKIIFGKNINDLLTIFLVFK